MTVKELREAMANFPDDLMVLVPVGMDWMTPVGVSSENVVSTSPPYWMPRKDAKTENQVQALLICPSER